MTECECGGANFDDMSNHDIISLHAIMRKRTDDICVGLTRALELEMKKRTMERK